MAEYTREQLQAALERAQSANNLPMVARIEQELGIADSDRSVVVDSRPDTASFGTAVGQGATFGFLDELRGLAGQGLDYLGEAGFIPNALTGTSSDFEYDASRAPGYRAYRDSERAAYDRYRDENPNLAMAGEMLGGLVTGGTGAARAGATNVGRRVAANIAAAPTRRRLGLLSATGGTAGAGGGALAGAGEARELTDIPAEALKGAAIGGTAGAILGPIADAGVSALQTLRGAVDADRLAARRVAGALDEAGLSPADARRELDANPGAVLADVGAGPRAELEAVVQAPGTSRQAAEELFTTRSRTQPAEIEELVGGPGQRSQTIEALEADRSSRAPALYDAAYRAPTPMTDELDSLWNSRRIRAIWNDKTFRDRAEDISEDEGLPFDRRLFETAEPSTQGWDYIIRELDRQYRNLASSAPGDARGVAKLRARVMKAVGNSNPALRDARQYWAGGEQFKESLEEGRRFFTTSADELGAQLRRMSDADRAAYRHGVRQAITDKLDKDGWTHDSAKHFRTRGMEKKFAELFDTEEEAADFFARIDQLTDQQRTMNQALRGSRTASTQARQQELTDAAKNAIVEAATGNYSGLAQRALALALRATPSGRGSVRDRVGSALLETDPARQRQILDDLLRRAEMPSARGGGAGLITPATVLPALIAGQQGGSE